MQVLQQEHVELLVQAFLSLRTAGECRAFLSDLMTAREILELDEPEEYTALPEPEEPDRAADPDTPVPGGE